MTVAGASRTEERGPREYRGIPSAVVRPCAPRLQPPVVGLVRFGKVHRVVPSARRELGTTAVVAARTRDVLGDRPGLRPGRPGDTVVWQTLGNAAENCDGVVAERGSPVTGPATFGLRARPPPRRIRRTGGVVGALRCTAPRTRVLCAVGSTCIMFVRTGEFPGECPRQKLRFSCRAKTAECSGQMMFP